MADPLSITASIIGIIVLALHGTRLLLSVLSRLELLKGVKEEDWKSLGQNVAAQLKATISSCSQAYNLFRADLQNCKLVINLIVGVITLYSSVRNSHDEVNLAITTADRQLVVVENKLEELNLSSDDNDDATRSSPGKAEKLLNELLSKSQEEAIAKAAGNQTGSITVNFGPQNSGFQARNINGEFKE
ncbi:hypothetical protein DL95DRAFT_426993 [Leptodontidium sp. 2 PMI_412]|nr:hypothetical protein DL95DRAFT_426993 [Leptodontidium sp. 2 PMI_412]